MTASRVWNRTGFPALKEDIAPRPNACGLKGSHYNRSMATRRSPERDGGAVLEPAKSRVKPPPMFKVILLNDDYTPMDFVVVVLEKFFSMGREQATVVMLKVHREGRGVCGVFPKDLAATKVEQVSAFARQHQHPLACVMEEA